MKRSTRRRMKRRFYRKVNRINNVNRITSGGIRLS